MGPQWLSIFEDALAQAHTKKILCAGNDDDFFKQYLGLASGDVIKSWARLEAVSLVSVREVAFLFVEYSYTISSQEENIKCRKFPLCVLMLQPMVSDEPSMCLVMRGGKVG